MEVKNPYMYNGETMTPKIGSLNVGTKSVYIESYGCAMNFSDSEIVLSILILITKIQMTCSMLI